ncbi:phosphodiester glycosidase family protein [Desulfovibrio inopinatus]|uniref:phosphodiester glycosidase family protein n=1 Tax=Desulfovibrio inopinatus TaxID=102109 RepID=UPI000403F207|nr:phosphodiester glycosidase family protein [Desulfovibrio inopinatus]
MNTRPHSGYGLVFIGLSSDANREDALVEFQHFRENNDVIVETRLRPKQVMTRYPLSFDDAELLSNRLSGLGVRCHIIDLSPVTQPTSGITRLGLLLALSLVYNIVVTAFLVFSMSPASEPKMSNPPPISAFALGADLFDYGGEDYTSFLLDIDETDVRLFWKGDSGQHISNFSALSHLVDQHGYQLVFATNAGIFNPDFRPVGLYVEEGREIVPLELGDGYGNFYMKPNGVFYITDNRAGIVASEQYPHVAATHHVRFATQSGPLLLQDGTLNPLFTEGSKHRKIRSGVGIIGDKIVVFVKSNEPVSFYEFATMFRDKFGCRSALYLDGVISNMFIREFDPVPFGGDKFGAMIAVVEKHEPVAGNAPTIELPALPTDLSGPAVSDNPAGQVEPDNVQ